MRSGVFILKAFYRFAFVFDVMMSDVCSESVKVEKVFRGQL